MKNLKRLLGCVALAAFSMGLSAQEQVQGFVHQQSKATDYVWPTDQQVLDKLDKWQDQKFGVLFHWGLYSVLGCRVMVHLFGRCGLDKPQGKFVL